LRTPLQSENRSLRIFRALALLKSGTTASMAQTEIDTISARLQKEYPATNDQIRIQFIPLYERIVGNVRLALLILLCTVGFVLLIACANVANLMLARTTVRAREIAVRAALGATRRRLLRQLLTESVILSSTGGFLGLLLAMWIIEALTKLNPGDIPRLSTITINTPVLLFTLLISFITGILFGIVPALQITRTNLYETLKEGGRGSSGVIGKYFRNGLVIAEISLSMIVLIGAGLLINSFSQLLKVDSGVVSNNLLTATVELAQYKEPHKRADISKEIVARVGEISGVQAAGIGTGLPPETAQRATRFLVEGQDQSTSNLNNNSSYFIAISQNYFRALGTPLLQGRDFNEHDKEDTQKVVIISEQIARQFFPNQNPIGKQLKLINPEQSDEWRSIVGVVKDIRYSGLEIPDQPTVYTPFSQTPFLWNYLMVRTTGDPEKITATLRSVISSIDTNLIAARIQPMDMIISRSISQPRLNMLLLSTFAMLALILAAVGLYGVLSYSVSQRTREIGIRMALGAHQSDILKMVLGHGLKLTLIGIVIGTVAAYLLTRLMSSLLFGISPTDPITFSAIGIILATVAILASYIPAKRAIKVDPMIALRYE
jgi:putative ABC transport system permease protein